jgi:hypothetical protein
VRQLKLANKAYFSLLGVMRCKDIHKKTKVMLYKTLICTVSTYESETWTLSGKSENVQSSFERKILRRIYVQLRIMVSGGSDTTRNCMNLTLQHV